MFNCGILLVKVMFNCGILLVKVMFKCGIMRYIPYPTSYTMYFYNRAKWAIIVIFVPRVGLLAAINP